MATSEDDIPGIEILISKVEGLDIPKGTKNSLRKKLEGAIKNLKKGDIVEVIEKMESFKDEVEAQSGKKIEEGDAECLIDMAEIIIAGNQAPTITSPAAVEVFENQTNAIDVQSADDNDSEGVGGGLTYSKTGGADEDLFNLDTSTGVLTFMSAPDYENPEDAGEDNMYNVQVTVADSGLLTAVQDIKITVTDVNENTAPEIISAAAVEAEERQTGVTDVDSTDDNDLEGAGLTYSITGGADQTLFTITVFGILVFNEPPDFENPGDDGTDNVYNVQVTVEDSGGLTDVQDIVVTVTNVLMVEVPAGTFQMGEAGNDGGEQDVPAFEIDETEVTQAAYNECVSDSGCTAPIGGLSNPGDNNPVEGVSWFQAVEYCQWRGARLPTEREWEYAARGQSTPPAYPSVYPWGDTFVAGNVNYFGSGIGTTTPVGN